MNERRELLVAFFLFGQSHTPEHFAEGKRVTVKRTPLRKQIFALARERRLVHSEELARGGVD